MRADRANVTIEAARVRTGVRLSLGVLAAALLTPLFAQSSAHFFMKRVSLNAGAGAMASTNYSNSLSTGQSLVGSASFCNAGSRTTAGFWSVLGVAPVPLILTGRRNVADPFEVDLSWSGVDTVYQLYRAFTPTDVLNPGNLDRETSSCNATDKLAFQSDIIFYSVIPKP